jgi:hypothetical protein
MQALASTNEVWRREKVDCYVDDRVNGAGIKNAGAASSRLLVEDVHEP